MVFIELYFRLEKGDFTSMKNNGFIWIESLVSLSVIMLLATIIFPVYSSVKKEKRILHDRTVISLFLYDELQRELYYMKLQENRTETITISDCQVTLTFKNEDEYVKGCVTWINVKGRTENFCLYGISQE